jgi:hypothetical protein
MLLLGSELAADGLTVYRDHISPRTFHYLPTAPHLTTINGKPGIALQLYRGTTGGGFLSLDVNVHPDAALIARAEDALTRRFNGPVDLVPVLLAEASVRLTMLDSDATPPRLVERAIGTARPSLSGDARAIFSLTLTREAATLVEAALRTGTAPVAIVYDLAFNGLHPARGLKIRIAYQMSYDYLHTRAALNSLWFKADLDREIEALRRDGHIEIEDVDYGATDLDPDTAAKRRDEVRPAARAHRDAVLPAGSLAGDVWRCRGGEPGDRRAVGARRPAAGRISVARPRPARGAYARLRHDPDHRAARAGRTAGPIATSAGHRSRHRRPAGGCRRLCAGGRAGIRARRCGLVGRRERHDRRALRRRHGIDAD